MRGMEETFGMDAGASVRKGKTAKQVKRARKNIDAAKKAKSKVSPKPEIRTNNTSGRRAYGGVPQKAPKANLSSSGYFMQSADTRETVPKAYAKSARKRQGRYGS